MALGKLAATKPTRCAHARSWIQDVCCRPGACARGRADIRLRRVRAEPGARRRAAAVDRPAVAGRRQAEAGLRPVGGDRQCQGRHHRRRQDLQGRDRLCRLCLQHAARGAGGRAADHRRQGQLPVLAVRLGRRQGRQQRVGEVRHPDHRGHRLVGAGLRPGLQVSVRNIHAQRHPDRAARGYRGQARRQREAGRHSRPQRPVPAGDRRGDAEVGEEAQSRRRDVREIFHRHHGPRIGHHADARRPARLDLRDRLHQRPDPHPQADEGSRRGRAGRHHDRRSRLQGVHRRGRPAGGEHFERGLVASGRALRRQGRVRIDRELQQALECEEQGRAGLCAGLGRGRRRGAPARDREGGHARSGKGARRARRARHR